MTGPDYVTFEEHKSGKRIACLAPMGGEFMCCFLPDDHEGGHMLPLRLQDRLRLYGSCGDENPAVPGRYCCAPLGHEGHHHGLGVGTDWLK